MKRERFPITSEQMELLLAFEAAGNLQGLADRLAKDASVVSRNLQKLAGELPVLAKAAGRWRITPLGRQLNVLSREYLAKLEELAGKKRQSQVRMPTLPDDSLLITINVQKALHDPSRRRRSNAGAEENIRRLLQHWRKQERSIIHVKHVSQSPASFFFKESSGVEFIRGLEPRAGEVVIEKSKAGAFTATKLEKIVRQMNPGAVVLVGFTGGECIDATARQASDLGFRTIVVGDATATFDIVGPNGKLHKADKVHQTVLANLHELFAEVVETDSILG